MKIGIFTDPHYNHADHIGGGRRPRLSYGKVKAAMEAFRAAGVSLCFCLGDLTDHAVGDTREDVVACFREILALIRTYPIPFYVVPGNHDYLMMTAADMEKEGIPTPPYTVTRNGWDFIVLDANYRTSMERFDTAGVVWTDANLPPEQLAYLEKALAEGDRPCVILVHELLDPYLDDNHTVRNAKAVRAILARSPRVRCVWQGHYHDGGDHRIDGIPYRAFPAMCQGEDNPYFVIDLP